MTYWNRTFVVLSLISVISLPGQDDFVFRHLSVKEGLSSPSPYQVKQDKYGLYWIITGDGLNLFDGKGFTAMRHNPDDPTSLPSNDLRRIHASANGELWIGGNGFLAKYDYGSEQFKSYPLIEPLSNTQGSVIEIFDWHDGGLKILTSRGPFDYNKKLDSLYYDPNPQKIPRAMGGIRDVLFLPDSTFYLAQWSNQNYGIMISKVGAPSVELHPNPQLAKLDSVIQMMRDDSGNIWFATLKGLYRYNPELDEVRKLEIRDGQQTLNTFPGIIQDKSGFIWFIAFGDGLVRFNPVTEEYILIKGGPEAGNGLLADSFFSIYEDQFGVIWICTFDDGLYTVDPHLTPFINYSIERGIGAQKLWFSTSNIVQFPNDKRYVWLGLEGASIGKYDLQTKTLKLIDPDLKQRLNIDHLLADPARNSLWASVGRQGITQYNISTGKRISHFSEFAEKINGNIGREIKLDELGRIWISGALGLATYTPEADNITFLPIVSRVSLPGILSEKIEEVMANNVILADLTKAGEDSTISAEFTIESDQQVMIYASGEGVVANTMFDYGWIEDAQGNRLWQMNDPDQTFHSGGAFKNRSAIHFAKLKPGKYKVSFFTDVGHSFNNWNMAEPDNPERYGIQVLTIDDEVYEDLSARYRAIFQGALPFENVADFVFSRENKDIIWLAAARLGLVRYNRRTGAYSNTLLGGNDPVNHGTIFNVLEDKYGKIWCNTKDALHRYDPKSNTYETYADRQGIPASNIRAILTDDDDNIWFNHDSGIIKVVVRESGFSLIEYDTKDGLKASLPTKAKLKSANGQLYLGFGAGFSSFFPPRPNSTPPIIQITRIRINRRVVYPGSPYFSIPDNVFYLKEVTLPHDKNSLDFKMTAIHSSRPGKNIIYYRLVGFNDEWQSDSRNFVRYTNLDPGEYSFEVKGRSADGIESVNNRAIRIIIDPPWWNTWWAYILYLLVFAGIIIRVRSVELNKRMQAAMIKEAELKAKAAELQAQAAEAQSRAVQAENERKTKELEDARALQLSMLPTDIPQFQGLEIAVYMKTATEVGGDYYDFSEMADGSLNIAIGDATGHGMKAGTLVSVMKAFFTAGSSKMGLEAFFESANTALKKMRLERVMMGFAMLNIKDDGLKYANAGMPPMLHYHKETDEVREVKLNDLPLGAMANSRYKSLDLIPSPGDVLLLLSDGMPELLNSEGAMFGYERIAEHLKQMVSFPSEKIIDHLKKSGSEWVADKDPEDDVTFVVVKIT